jgi:large subunit ribosomal protein L5
MSSLQQKYTTEVVDILKKQLDVKNPMAIPGITKIVINLGVKNAVMDKKNIESAKVALTQISGQKPKVTKAKKSIASFKLREGDEIGLMVTLRGKRMYGFLEKLISVVLPRLRDFRGVSRTSFDGRGNYALGFSEHTVFPEIDPGKVDKIHGLEVIIVTSAKNNKEGFALLEALGMPFIKG